MRVRLLILTAAAAALLVAPAAFSHATAPRFKVSLYAPTHNPHVGAKWRYSIKVTNLVGNPIEATAKQEIRTSRGLKVDVIGWNSFKGSFARSYRWPAADRGKDLVFTIRVVGPGGTRILKYAVKVV
ncbi:MAG: hypothetical protein QOE36_2535 [Gaiellaceae bacterium]|jgi:uncharacterized protein (DUF58 family)|nr:hypothetical protein [Gaiellaceae bacterium]